MKTKSCLIVLFTIIISIASCKRESPDDLKKFPEIKTETVKLNLIKYSKHQDGYIKAIESKNLGLMNLYNDSANYYDSLVNVDVANLSKRELVFFNQYIETIKNKKINLLSKVNTQKNIEKEPTDSIK